MISPNHGEETETQMVWLHFNILWHCEGSSAGDSERNKKEWKTEKATKITSKSGQ